MAEVSGEPFNIKFDPPRNNNRHSSCAQPLAMIFNLLAFLAYAGSVIVILMLENVADAYRIVGLTLVSFAFIAILAADNDK
jgi:hypothetical protein